MTDIGSALLADVEHLLDHATEHQVEVHRASAGGRWSSPGWLLVTVYYWAFFLSAALTRLVGRTVWFLDGTALKDLQRLAPGNTMPSAHGTYALLCGPPLSVTHRDVRIRALKGHYHEALWNSFYAYVNQLFDAFSNPAANNLEHRAFACLKTLSSRANPLWPSNVRNVVNYRPGFAYDAVRGGTFHELVGFVRGALRMSPEQVVDAFEDQLSQIARGETVTEKPRQFPRLLILTALLLHSLAHDLLQDVTARHGFDARWQIARARFRERALAA